MTGFVVQGHKKTPVGGNKYLMNNLVLDHL